MPIIALAASAGGVHALSRVLSGLPEGFQPPILIAQHLTPGHPSELVSILSKHTALNLRDACQGEEIAPGHIYVAPPGRHLQVCPDGTLFLPSASTAGLGRPSADVLFQSLAESVSERAVAVVLSGLSSDGAAGIRAVRAAGGITIAQDEQSCQFFAMPQSAIETGCVDFVLPLAKIAARLVSLHNTYFAFDGITPKSQRRKMFSMWEDSPDNIIKDTLTVDTKTEGEKTHRARLAEEVARTRSQAAALQTRAIHLRREAGVLSAKARSLGQEADNLASQRESPQTQRQRKAQRKVIEETVYGLFRDVLASVTEGKLRLCKTPNDLPPMRGLSCDPILLTQTNGLRELRQQAKQEAIGLGLSEERWHDFVAATQEAGMNAVVHAGGGTSRISTNGENTIQVRVEDRGRGIDVENLPRALLEKGFSTAGTFGHGMKMMILAADRIWLLTGSMGTVVVLEQDRTEPKPVWL